ncbi:MAG TPA: group III truncated hemoglobin [Sulfurovum sp.]|nr:group III truncated hemoglobin [Sulfurovum sp.]
MQADKITHENVRLFVMKFYAKIIKDETVGPFFIEKLGDDLDNDSWKEHLEFIVVFWTAIAFGEPKYTRQLFLPHTQLGDVKRETFEQWLNLFDKTQDEVYIEKIADKFKERAHIIAGNFMRNLGLS